MKIRLAMLVAVMALPATMFARSERKVYQTPVATRSAFHSATCRSPMRSSASKWEIRAAELPRPRIPEEALGPPDYDDKRQEYFVTLGCGGTLTLSFTNNVLIDVPGPDLYVFEKSSS